MEATEPGKKPGRSTGSLRPLLLGFLLFMPGVLPAQTRIPVATPRPVAHSPVARAVAALATGAALLAFSDHPFREELSETRGSPLRQSTARVGNVFGTGRVMFPVMAALTMGSHLAGEETVARAGSRAIASAAVAGLAATAVKMTFGRARPNAGLGSGHFELFKMKDSSFPSGHTTIAFAFATSLARSTPDRLSDVAFYGAATLTAFARMSDDKHWLTDVVAGAALGHLTGRLLTPTSRVQMHGLGVTVSF